MGRYRPDAPTGSGLLHRMVVNEFLLKAMLLADTLPGVTLLDHEHEKSLNAKRLQVPVETDTGETKTARISPDLMLHFEIAHPKKQYRFLPEINRSRMWEKDWREKVRAYCFSIIPQSGRSPFEERFGTDLLTSIPLLVASPVDYPVRDLTMLTPEEKDERRFEAGQREKRMWKILKWTEAELTKLNLEDEADMFSFSAAPLDEISPYDLFFSPIWIIPFDYTPRPLMHYRRGDDGR